MKLCGIDFETTGLDFEKDRICEIGAVLWDTELRQPVQIYSALVLDTTGPGISAEVEAIHGISSGMLAENGESPETAFEKLFNMMGQADFAVAHFGGQFDKPMAEAQAGRFEAAEAGSEKQWVGAKYPRELLWIDTAVDIEFPPKIKTRNLRHLAAEHGFLNPFAHRAVFDVLTMLLILDKYPLPGVIESARQPLVTLKALVTYGDNGLAKARGYKWNPDRKEWTLQLKAGRVEKERAECGFQTLIINPQN